MRVVRSLSILGIGIAACASLLIVLHPKSRSEDIKIPHPKNSPDGQIYMLSFEPAARCVLDINESLTVQFRHKVPESPCQIFARLGSNSNYNKLSKHGFTLGSSACSGLVQGNGILKQSCSLFYNPKTDQMGPENSDFPKLYHVTNMVFTVYGGSITNSEKYGFSFIRNSSSRRKVYSIPIDATWVCKKYPFLEYRQKLVLNEWEKVKKLYPDATLPEPKQKHSKKKKATLENCPEP